MANPRPKRPNPTGMLFYPLDRDIIVMLNKKLGGEDLLHDNINDPPVDLYSASPAALLGNAAPNNVLKKQHVVYTSRKPMFDSNGKLTGYDRTVSNIGEWRVYGSPDDVFDEKGIELGSAHTSCIMKIRHTLKREKLLPGECLNHEIVCALDPLYDAAQTFMDMMNSGHVKNDDEPAEDEDDETAEDEDDEPAEE